MITFVRSPVKLEAMEKDINRLKIVLAEKKKTNKWLAQQLQKDPATVSKWCTNSAQPALETLIDIAHVLEVDVKELLHSSQEENVYIKISKELF
jgi:transcriptional regulator with XRE-family HTH domain